MSICRVQCSCTTLYNFVLLQESFSQSSWTQPMGSLGLFQGGVWTVLFCCGGDKVLAKWTQAIPCHLSLGSENKICLQQRCSHTPEGPFRAADSFAGMAIHLGHAMNQRGAWWISADGCHAAGVAPKIGWRSAVRFNGELWGHKTNCYKIIQAKLLLNSRELFRE